MEGEGRRVVRWGRVGSIEVGLGRWGGITLLLVGMLWEGRWMRVTCGERERERAGTFDRAHFRNRTSAGGNLRR